MWEMGKGIYIITCSLEQYWLILKNTVHTAFPQGNSRTDNEITATTWSERGMWLPKKDGNVREVAWISWRSLNCRNPLKWSILSPNTRPHWTIYAKHVTFRSKITIELTILPRQRIRLLLYIINFWIHACLEFEFFPLIQVGWTVRKINS